MKLNNLRSTVFDLVVYYTCKWVILHKWLLIIKKNHTPFFCCCCSHTKRARKFNVKEVFFFFFFISEQSPITSSYVWYYWDRKPTLALLYFQCQFCHCVCQLQIDSYTAKGIECPEKQDVQNHTTDFLEVFEIFNGKASDCHADFIEKYIF